MRDSQQNKKQSYLLLNVLLIILETFFSFILKHDAVIRLHAQHFVDKKITLRINSYFPYFDFYVRFTEQGILFDREKPAEEIDLDVRSTLFDLIKIFVFANRRSIKTLRIDGDAELRDQLKDLLLYFSFPKLFTDWTQWLKKPHEAEQAQASRKRIAPLLAKITAQRSEINSLKVELKQHKNKMRELRQRQCTTNIAFITVIVVLAALLVYTVLLH